MKKFLLLSVLVFAVAACEQKKAPQAPAAPAADAAAPAAPAAGEQKKK